MDKMQTDAPLTPSETLRLNWYQNMMDWKSFLVMKVFRYPQTSWNNGNANV